MDVCVKNWYFRHQLRENALEAAIAHRMGALGWDESPLSTTRHFPGNQEHQWHQRWEALIPTNPFLPFPGFLCSNHPATLVQTSACSGLQPPSSTHPTLLAPSLQPEQFFPPSSSPHCMAYLPSLSQPSVVMLYRPEQVAEGKKSPTSECKEGKKRKRGESEEEETVAKKKGTCVSEEREKVGNKLLFCFMYRFINQAKLWHFEIIPIGSCLYCSNRANLKGIFAYSDSVTDFSPLKSQTPDVILNSLQSYILKYKILHADRLG